MRRAWLKLDDILAIGVLNRQMVERVSRAAMLAWTGSYMSI